MIEFQIRIQSEVQTDHRLTILIQSASILEERSLAALVSMVTRVVAHTFDLHKVSLFLLAI
jgi:hypothetical protein